GDRKLGNSHPVRGDPPNLVASLFGEPKVPVGACDNSDRNAVRPRISRNNGNLAKHRPRDGGNKRQILGERQYDRDLKISLSAWRGDDVTLGREEGRDLLLRRNRDRGDATPRELQHESVGISREALEVGKREIVPEERRHIGEVSGT